MPKLDLDAGWCKKISCPYLIGGCDDGQLVCWQSAKVDYEGTDWKEHCSYVIEVLLLSQGTTQDEDAYGGTLFLKSQCVT